MNEICLQSPMNSQLHDKQRALQLKSAPSPRQKLITEVNFADRNPFQSCSILTIRIYRGLLSISFMFV